MATISISEMTTQATATATDLFEVAVADGNSASGYATKKMSADVIANGMLNTYTYPVAMPNMQNRTIIGAINTLLANFASVYDSTATYAVDDVVTYNGVLYKCTTAITTAEAFDSSKWTAITITDYMGSSTVNYSTTEHIVGTWIDGSLVYEITVNIGSLSTGINYINVSQIANMDKVIDLSGMLHQSTFGQWIPIEHIHQMSAEYMINATVLLNDSQLRITVGTDWQGFSEGFATIRYTKTSS